MPPYTLSVRLLRITWPFLASVLLLVLLAAESLDIMSATRAYVGGESLWSKAQKDAVYRLFRYSQSRDESDFAAYKTAIAVPMGDRRARLELEKPDPDLAVVRTGFIAGKNDPDDVDGMIMLFRRFHDISFMKKAIGIWRDADERIAELDAAADELHARIAERATQPEQVAPILARIENVNDRLTPLEEAFSNTLGEASRKTQALLQAVFAGAAFVLVVGGAAVSRRMLRKSDALERALTVSEERFDLAVSGSEAGIWDWNVRTNEMYYSPRYKELLGYADGEFANKIDSFVDHLHPDDREARVAALNEHLRHGAPYADEIRLRSKSGEYRWFQARGRSVRDASGEALRMAGAITDITDRKRAEAQLFAERDRAQVTLRSIAEGVITTDREGLVETINPAAQAMTGWKNVEAAGKPLASVFRVFDETNRAQPLEPVPALLRDGRNLMLGRDTILERRDGGEIAVAVSAAPIRGHDGAAIGAVFVFYDVTDDRRSKAQLSYQARHDPLTGTPNRREFEHRLSRALIDAAEVDRHHALLFLDLDRFKSVNDAAGHSAGDAVLRDVSALLARKLRQGDTLARLGGDEFGVLLENCPLDSAVRIADTLREAVAEYRFSWNQRQFALGVSVGLVPIGAARRYSVAEVLSMADACCYQAKRSGRNRVQIQSDGDTDASKRQAS